MQIKKLFIISTLPLILLLASCRIQDHHVTDNPALLRQQAVAKRAHASGLREDISDLARMIADSADAGEASYNLRHRLHELDEKIRITEAEIEDLKAKKKTATDEETARELERELQRRRSTLDVRGRQRKAAWEEMRRISDESVARLETALAEAGNEVRELEGRVEELEEERAGLDTYEAFKMTGTLQRWQNNLETAKHRKDALKGRILATKSQIKGLRQKKEANMFRAQELEKQAAGLEKEAARLDSKQTEPEEDFWSMW